MKGAILGVMATNKMKAGFLGLMPKPSAEKIKFSIASATKEPSQPTETTSTTTTVNSEPFKELVVKVIAGKDLVAKDYNGKSDPYISIWCGASKYKTKTKKATLNPEWNEIFVIPSSVCARKELDIECWDADTTSSDEFMGTFKIAVDSIPVGKSVSTWYNLGPSKAHKGAVGGDVHIEFTKNA